MGVRFHKIYEDNMKNIDDKFQLTALNFKVLLEMIESMEARLAKLEKSTEEPHFEAETDDGETES